MTASNHPNHPNHPNQGNHAKQGTTVTSTSAQVFSIEEFANSFGKTLAVGGNNPIPLDDSATAYFVKQGAIDVFLAEQLNDTFVSTFKHVLRAEQGRVVFGVSSHSSSLHAVSRALPDTKVAELRVDELLNRCVPEEVASQIDEWTTEFSASVTAQIEPHPQPDLILDPSDAKTQLDDGLAKVVSARAGKLIWLKAPGLTFLHTEDSLAGDSGFVPLTEAAWLTIEAGTQPEAVDSAHLLRQGTLSTALNDFHNHVLNVEQINKMFLVADSVNEQVELAKHRRRDHKSAREDLYALVNRPSSDSSGSVLLATLRLIGEREGINIVPPPQRFWVGREPTLRAVLDASGVRARKVRLVPNSRWWLGDSGTMIAFSRQDKQPLALFAGVGGRYHTVDVVSGRKTRVNAARARNLASDAWLFYPSLPANREVSGRDLLRLAGSGIKQDFIKIVFAGLIGALLSQVPAITIGILVSSVLPFAANSMLLQAMLALGGLVGVGVVLKMLQGTALMRIEGRVETRLTAALWDRLLSLPTSFFRGFPAGELAVRMGTFLTLRDQLSGVVANASLGLVFLLPTLVILFVYDTALALVAMAFALLALFVTTVVGVRQVAPIRLRFQATRQLSGDLVQFINGMSKLRVAGAQTSAFASWARTYRTQHLANIAISRRNERLAAFQAGMPILLTAVLFLVAGGSNDLAVSEFLVVYAVAMTFFAAASGLSRSVGAIAAVLVGYEQIKPILTALPEGHQAKGHQADGHQAAGNQHVGGQVQLSGGLRFDRVGFRYLSDGPTTINEVSLYAKPGEFVAIVGASGSGKSTLMRLALGLERPTSGGIYFDGHDLANLDCRSVRRQIGVVTQDGILQPGSILDNIIGMDDDLTIEDAWRAARLADVDGDIAEMPMEMFTVVSGSTASFSGGQVQRIRIAAALVRNPRLVLLDEATSWLDSQSQSEVMKSIERLAATRVVVAHRLSTIRAADRIYVLDAGRVVQQGTFAELVAVEGVFHQLVSRQLSSPTLIEAPKRQ